MDADTVARRVHQDPTHPATRTIARNFAPCMTADGALQRGSLHAVFARNASANQRLIDILKPHVLNAILRWSVAQHAPYVMWESALLLREDMAADRLLIVDAPVTLRTARVRVRNPDWTEQHIQNILAMQAQTRFTGALAVDILSNDGSLAHLQEQVKAMHHHYTTLWS